MGKRTKNYQEISLLVEQGIVTKDNRNFQAGISVDAFNSKAESLGYTTSFYLNHPSKNGTQSINSYSIRGVNSKTNKNVVSPVELTAKQQQLQADINIYTLSQERQQALISAVSEAGFEYEHTGNSRGNGDNKGKCRISCKSIEEFFEIVSFITDIDELVAKSSGGGVRIATQICSREQADDSVFLTIAKLYRVAVECNGQYHLNDFRTLLCADKIDHMITRGVSRKYKEMKQHDSKEEKSRREHVVPCVQIHNRVIEIIQNGATDIEVASFIKQHMIIVMISDEERRHLDHTLGLQNEMPSDWQWGQDVYARLTVADIEWESI